MGDCYDVEIDEKLAMYSANFIDFCIGDMCLFNMNFFCATYGLMKSAMVTMQSDVQHDVATSSQIYSLPVHRSKRDAGMDRIAHALIAPIRVHNFQSADLKVVEQLRCQRDDSTAYSHLRTEYMQLAQKLDDQSMPPELMQIDRTRLAKLKVNLMKLSECTWQANSMCAQKRGGFPKKIRIYFRLVQANRQTKEQILK